MHYKVCILTAGVGSRMGTQVDHINKALLPVSGKAVLSHIVEKFPADVEIVFAVGHKKETVVDYLTLAYPERTFSFVEVDKYIGPGTGPGYSLLACKAHLQSPFVFVASDTIVLEGIPTPDHNWFGVSPVKETERYCTVQIKNNLIHQLDDKTKNNNKFAFIGLAGVKDYEAFFAALENNKEIIGGEIQVSNGFKKLIEYQMAPVGFTWFDTGTEKNYAETCKNFSGGAFNFNKGRGEEFIYFVNSRVIKFFADPAIVFNRHLRAKECLHGLCPPIENQRPNFYSYKKVDGQVLYTVLNAQIAKDFLRWAKINLWKKHDLSVAEQAEFIEACRRFYHTKTIDRLHNFYQKTAVEDEWHSINGIATPPLKDLLAQVDWDYVILGTPSNFHGDLQFDNVLVQHDSATNLNKFILLDWRHDFGGLTHYGDVYYDLAKLYCGMIISYQMIKDGNFSFDMSGSSVYYSFLVKNNLIEAREEYEAFCAQNKYDLKKMRLITALIFLNMAPLHHDPFDLMLYFLGKSMLYKSIRENNRIKENALPVV